jgi:very-short-patch-repair endonuclease
MRKITTYARENRKKPTKAEAELRRKLLKWKIRFRSQRQFDFFIVDFLIPEKRLAIEVDGGYHANRTNYDNRRTKYLESLGLTIIRVSNKTVLTTNCEELKNLIVSYPSHDLSALPLRLSYGQSKY